MSDNLPVDVLENVFNRLRVKSLLRCRSVSKAWKSCIDSVEFIARHSTLHAHSNRLLVRYEIDPYDHIHENCKEYISFVDDETFPQQNFEPAVPESVEIIGRSRVIGGSLGLLCLYGEPYDYESLLGRSTKKIAVIWNPSIRKYVEIIVPNVLGGEVYKTVVGFGVRPDTSDIKLVKITFSDSSSQPERFHWAPWQVEVYTLSSGHWRSFCSNIPRKSIEVTWLQVVVDGFIYWFAFDRIAEGDIIRTRNLIMSFDMTTEEFVEVNLPDSLALPSYTSMSISKLRDSLVVLDYHYAQNQVCCVWEMKHGVPASFTKLFTIEPAVESTWGVLGFSKSGKPVILMENDDDDEYFCGLASLAVYEPCSRNMNQIARGQDRSFFVSSYVETLLLLHVPVEDE